MPSLLLSNLPLPSALPSERRQVASGGYLGPGEGNVAALVAFCKVLATYAGKWQRPAMLQRPLFCSVRTVPEFLMNAPAEHDLKQFLHERTDFAGCPELQLAAEGFVYKNLVLSIVTDPR